MNKKTLLSAVVLSAMLGGAMLSPVFAEEESDTDVTSEPEQTTDTDINEPEQTADADVSDSDRKFDDSVLLEETLIGWQEEKVTKADQDLTDAQDRLDNAPEDATGDEMAEINAAVEDAQIAYDEAVANFEDEKTKLTEQIAELTEEQLFALNRSLNNATNNGLIVDLNSEYMQDLLDGNYNKQQINSLTKALEEEAKFDKLSDKFISKFDATGNEKFLDKADMMSSKGDRQKDKFLAKVDKFDRTSMEDDYRSKAKKSARDSAKSSARDASKKSVKNDSKRAAKNNAKKVAKETARDRVKTNNGKKKT